MSGNYIYAILVPAETNEDTPLDTELILSPGLIDQIAIMFPPGCSALAHLQIIEENDRIFPVSPDGSYAWDNTILTFNPQYYLRDDKPKLIARCWNEDTFYDHTITLMINILPIRPDDINILTQLKLLVNT